MSKFIYLNISPDGERKNDCVTRAITLVSGLDYAEIRKKLFHTAKLLDCEKLCPTCYSFLIQEVIGGVPKNCDGMTVNDFADTHAQGKFLIRIQGHLTTIIDGTIFDIWDCGYKVCDMAWQVR